MNNNNNNKNNNSLAHALISIFKTLYKHNSPPPAIRREHALSGQGKVTENEHAELSIIVVRILHYLGGNKSMSMGTLPKIIPFTILSTTGDFRSALKCGGVVTEFFDTCLGSDFMLFRIPCK